MIEGPITAASFNECRPRFQQQLRQDVDHGLSPSFSVPLRSQRKPVQELFEGHPLTEHPQQTTEHLRLVAECQYLHSSYNCLHPFCVLYHWYLILWAGRGPCRRYDLRNKRFAQGDYAADHNEKVSHSFFFVSRSFWATWKLEYMLCRRK
jgi:hypothetical protein